MADSGREPLLLTDLVQLPPSIPRRTAAAPANHLSCPFRLPAGPTLLPAVSRPEAQDALRLITGWAMREAGQIDWLKHCIPTRAHDAVPLPDRRAAELAGLDPGEVLAEAVAERDLTGARDIPAVIDARIRRRHGDLAPLPAPAWSAQVPETDHPARCRFLTALAAAMDDRRRRIGEHAAASTLPWAAAVLGAISLHGKAHVAA